MNYSKIQKIISSFLLFIFFFGQIFGLSFFSLFSSSAFAENRTFHDLVSIIVNENVYSKLDDEIERYAKDIQGYLDNTRVVIIPVKEENTAFQIASINESLFYEGYKSLKNVDFESRLIGSVFIGNIDLPIVEENGKTTRSIVPFVDFDDKKFIYEPKTNLFEKNRNNIDGLKAEIFHGFISPNSGNTNQDIQQIEDFLDKDHDFYTGRNNFDNDLQVLNGNKNDGIPTEYKPYVFYFDELREQKSLSYSAYKGYDAYLNNREDITYNRFSVELADKIKNEVLGAQNDELSDIIGNIDNNEIKTAFANLNGPDISTTTDISTKSMIEGTTNNFLEIFNKGTISDFRTNVHNAGRYNEGKSGVNVDTIPYFISVLDLIGDKVVKSANTDLEKQIDDLVINSLAKDIKIPEQIINNISPAPIPTPSEGGGPIIPFPVTPTEPTAIQTGALVVENIQVDDTEIILSGGVEIVLYKANLKVGDLENIILDKISLIKDSAHTIAEDLNQIFSKATLNIGSNTFDATIDSDSIDFDSMNLEFSTGTSIEATVTAELMYNETIVNEDVIAMKLDINNLVAYNLSGATLEGVNTVNANNKLTQTTLQVPVTFCGGIEHTNYYNGKKASDLVTAEDCSIYRGSTYNNGTLVEANRGLNVYLTQDDVYLCEGKNPEGIYSGSSPLNLDYQKISTDLNFSLKGYDLKKAVLPVFDIKGSKETTDASKIPSPLNCLENNFIKTYDDSNLCYAWFNNTYDVLDEKRNNPLSGANSNAFLGFNSWTCDSDNIIYEGDIENLVGAEHISGYNYIPSYIMHKSPTIYEINQQLSSNISPNLGIDKDRYIDFFSEEVDSITKEGSDSYQKIVYPNLYRLFGEEIEDVESSLDILLDKKSEEINSIGGETIDLKSYFKNKEIEDVDIGGEVKEVSYYDFLVFSIYWNGLTNISAKYKFVLENYLSDQIGGNDFNFILAKNKKEYEIAYMGAHGDAQNMYVKMDPEGRFNNPYSDLISRNSLFVNSKLSIGVLNADNQIGFEDEGLFKCAPPEGVPIREWIPAIMCRLNNLLPVEISVGEGSCGSSEIFETEEDYYELTQQKGVCVDDLNKNGVNDCVEDRLLNDGDIDLSSDSSRYFFGQRGKLKTVILDKNDKKIMLDNSSYISFNLEKIVDKSTNKVVYNSSVDDFYENLDLINQYVYFKPTSIRSSYGTTIYGFSAKNKEADLYFSARLDLKPVTNNNPSASVVNISDIEYDVSVDNEFIEADDKSIITLDSETLVVKVRSERLFLNSYSFDNTGEVSLTGKSAVANSSTNVYLFSGKNNSISNYNVNNNSLVFELLNLGKDNSERAVNFPITVSLEDSTGKLIQKDTIGSLSSLNNLYSIKKSGTYTIKIVDSYDYPIETTFDILAGEPEKLNIDLGSSVLEVGGSISTNLVSIFDKYDNLVTGEIYDFDLNILGNSVVFNQTNSTKLEQSTFEGFKAFRLKSLDNVGISKVRVDVYSDGKKILASSKNVKVIDEIKVDVDFSDILRVGNNDYTASLVFKDKNNNILSDLQSRVYMSAYNEYIDLKEPYTVIANGRAVIDFSTKTFAGEDINFDFRVEGFTNIITEFVTILPDKPMNISLVPTKAELEASESSETYVNVELKDVYNNTVFTDNNSIITLEIDEKYKTIINANKFSSKLRKGTTTFKLHASDLPGIAYLKFSINKNLEANEFVVGEGNKQVTINGISENALMLETYYFYKKENIVGNKYNALYTTLLGAQYGDITQKDYLAGAMLFDRNNRSLAVTSLINSPYNFKDALNIMDNGFVSKVYEGSDLTQDLTVKLKRDINSIYYLDLFNNALNIYIGKIYLNFDDLEITEETYSKIENELSLNLEEIFDIKDYKVLEAGNKIILDSLLSREKNSLIIYLETTEYNLRDLYSKDGNSKVISYNDPFSTDFSLNSFSRDSDSTYENFEKNSALGWGGGNKTLLAFSAGESVGDATKNYMGVLSINLGDPIISLKKIKKDSYGITKKFDSTIGMKLNNNDVFAYNVFDYNADGRDDILLLEENGFFSLLENTSSSKRFLDQKHLARVVDLGDKELVNSGDFSGDKYEDIFFVNDEGNPFLLDNVEKNFERVDLTDIFNLKGGIIQAKSFDMDNDGITDIVTLDNFGEINIFYGKAGTNNFDKKTLYSGYGIQLDSSARNDLGAIYFDGLAQEVTNPQNPDDATEVIPLDLLENMMFKKVSYDSGNNIDDENYTKQTVFIKSEFAGEAGIKVQKTFTDVNGGGLNTGDVVDVEIKLKNISGRTLRDIVYLEDIPEYFIVDLKSIKTSKEVTVRNAIDNYEFYIDKFTLYNNSELIINYQLRTRALNYSHLKVGLFEKGEAGDDKYGDVLLNASKYNCGGDSDIFRSTASRAYQKGIKVEQCDESVLPEELAKNDVDENNNGIPDYIDELKNDPEALQEYSEQAFVDYSKSVEIEEDTNIFDSLESLNESVDEISGKIDEFIEGFGCGFGGGSCFGMPINWAPLAPGNDPVVLGHLVGDGLKVDEGLPVFSTLTGLQMTCGHSPCCIPTVYPVSSLTYVPGPFCGPPGAGGYLGTNSATNYFRLFATPTLTGGAGIAACYGAPASAVGNVPPKGLNPVVPGGNCIVAAAPLPNLCEDEEISSDPGSIGQVDYLGGDFGNGNGGFGVINGNCDAGSNHDKLPITNKIDTTLARAYLDYKNNGVVGNNLIKSFESAFENPAKPGVVDYNSGLAANQPLISINGGTLDSSDVSVGLDFSEEGVGINFKGVEELSQERVAPFPKFITQWVNDQLEEFITKLTDFPTLFIILPDFSGVFNTDWGEYSKDLLNGTTNSYNKGVKKSNSLIKQTSGIKEAYEFLGRVPFVTIESEPVVVNIPWFDEESWNATKTQRELALGGYEGEIKNATDSWGNIGNQDIIRAQKFTRSLQLNLQTLETYKRLPEQLASLAGKKQEYLEQILCNIESIQEITGGWLDRNGKRFKAWVELYILIKAILKSWQLLADVFIDYDEQCHECKNERYDSLGAQFELVSMIMPSIPVVQFPKWPDIVLDLHNIRLNLAVVLPEFEFKKREIILPPAPNLILPEAPGISLELPELPILPQIIIPELPDLPSLPTVKLPDLPPPPQLPKLWSSIEGVLNILKLVTKAMCILKKSPFVPESRAGDQIAFLTESSGYRPFDFINLTMPQFSYPFVDEIKVTTFVNLEFESEFLVEMAKTIVEPINDMSSNFINMFKDTRINNLDFSEGQINDINIKLDIDKNDGPISYNENKISAYNLAKSISRGINNLTNYIKNKSSETLSNKEFLVSVNNQLSKEYIVKDKKFDELRESFDVVNNYTYSKENKLINELKNDNYEKFDILKSIIKREIKKQDEFKQDIKSIINGGYKTIANDDVDDIKLYNSSLQKYNKAFVNSAKALVEPSYLSTNSLKQEGEYFISDINNNLNSFSKKYKNNDYLALNTKKKKTKDYFALTATANNNQKVCSTDNSNYKRNYKGLYIIQEESNKKISYKLFDYLDELKGDEIVTEIDFDLDSDSDLIYSMDNNLYLKENLIKNKNNKIFLSGVEVLNISDNKFINGDIFYEAVNNATESFVSNENININFSASKSENVTNYRLEYYTIIDKYLNEGNALYNPNNIEVNIVDAFVHTEDNTIISNEDGIIKRNNAAYISELGNNIPKVTLKTKELINLKDSIISGNVAVVSSGRQIYTGGSSVKLSYFEGNSEDLKTIKIDAYSNVEFANGIEITGISGDAYISTNNDVVLTAQEIYNYLELPLVTGSTINKTGEFNSSTSSHVGIKYYDETTANLDFRKIGSYKLYDLGFMSDEYYINLSVENDYLYSRLQIFNDNIFGTKTSQILLSPQLESDKYAPEIDFNADVRVPVYQETIIDLTDAIYENSGYQNIASLEVGGLDSDKYEILNGGSKIRIKFGEFEEIFTKKIIFTVTDTNGNSATKDVNLIVYPPIPEITSYGDSVISGYLSENLTEEPINIYRYRGGVIQLLSTTSGNTKVDTVSGKFEFPIEVEESNLVDVTNNGEKIFSVNENTGKIDSISPGYQIKTVINDDNYVKVNIVDIQRNTVFSQVINLDTVDNEVFITNSFAIEDTEKDGLYLRLTNSEFDYYKIPDSAPYNPGALAIYRKTDPNKEALFAILPDFRIIPLNDFYKLEYSTFGDYIVLKLIDKHFNKEIGQLLIKIDNSYVIN